MPHSRLYQGYVKKHVYPAEVDSEPKEEQRLNVDGVGQFIKDASLDKLQDCYSELSDLLRETNDAQFGIVSQLVVTDEGEHQWVRDATRSSELENRLSHDSPVIEANNTLLRCLSRLRPIDFAIQGKYGSDQPGPECRDRLKSHFEQLTKDILGAAQSNKSDDEKLKDIKKLEEKFNTLLVKELHEANLTQGCETAADAEKLLFHYRNLSSLLEDPARTMVTLTYDKDAGGFGVLQRETQYPVTKKTAEQKKAIEQLGAIQPYPFKVEKNAHNVRNTATQEADALFMELMSKDTTALPAQARKTHLVGTKNAFIVKNELIKLTKPLVEGADLIVDPAGEKHTLWLARTGVPVYVGSGESSERIAEHTTQNLEQIRQAAQHRMGIKHLDLHITCLNTYSPLENQITMVKHQYQATRGKGEGDQISYAPTNPDGTFRAMDIAPNLQFAAEEQPVGSLPLQKADRLDQVTKIVLAAANTKSTVSIVQCASGQDRTGTAVEKATQSWMSKIYTALGLDTSNIDVVRAKGGNAAEITTHHIHGSPGMKKESMADNFFGKVRSFASAVSEQFYRSSANTNKKNKVGDVDFLKVPSAAALSQYQKNLKQFESSLEQFQKTILDDPKKQQFYQSGQALLKNIKQIAAKKPSARDIDDLNAALPHCTNIVNNHDKAESPGFKESVRRIASLSHHVSGKASPAWKAIGTGLLTFAGLALIAVGILAAIPSGGSSLLLAVAGAAGLGLGTAAAVGGGVIATSAVTGAVALKVGSEKGMARSISHFKSALQDMKPKPEEPASPSSEDTSDIDHSITNRH